MDKVKIPLIALALNDDSTAGHGRPKYLMCLASTSGIHSWNVTGRFWPIVRRHAAGVIANRCPDWELGLKPLSRMIVFLRWRRWSGGKFDNGGIVGVCLLFRLRLVDDTALSRTIPDESRANSNYSHPIPHYLNPKSHYLEPKLNDFIGGSLKVEYAGKIVRISFAIGRFSAAIVRISS
jgi:hypothetical protein